MDNAQLVFKLTKVDAISSEAEKIMVIDVLSGNSNSETRLEHSMWFATRYRINQDEIDEGMTLIRALEQETAFFEIDWPVLDGNLGAKALRNELSLRLMGLIRAQMSEIRRKIATELTHAQTQLELMGPFLDNPLQKRQFLNATRADYARH